MIGSEDSSEFLICIVKARCLATLLCVAKKRSFGRVGACKERRKKERLDEERRFFFFLMYGLLIHRLLNLTPENTAGVTNMWSCDLPVITVNTVVAFVSPSE